MAKGKIRVDFDSGAFTEYSFECGDKRAEELMVACIDKDVVILRPVSKPKSPSSSGWMDFLLKSWKK